MTNYGRKHILVEALAFGFVSTALTWCAFFIAAMIVDVTLTATVGGILSLVIGSINGSLFGYCLKHYVPKRS